MNGPSPLGRFLYALGKLMFWTAFKVLWRARAHGVSHVPKHGAVLFASNHVSNADPPLVGSMIPRNIHFMAKQELFDVPLLGWFIRQVNAFPVKRWARDVSAFKNAQRLLESGEALILFPEGTRQREGHGFGKPKPGVGMLAHKTGCRVVPVYVHNSGKLASFKPVAVCFGKPLTAEGPEDYEAFAREVMRRIHELKEAHFGRHP